MYNVHICLLNSKQYLLIFVTEHCTSTPQFVEVSLIKKVLGVRYKNSLTFVYFAVIYLHDLLFV